MNICIQVIPTNKTNGAQQVKGEWITSRIPPGMRDAYASYKERHHYYRESPHISGEYIVYRIDNDPYLPTYIARTADIPNIENYDIQDSNFENHITITRDSHNIMMSSSAVTPIIDTNDIYVFINDAPGNGRANWTIARDYQMWAFRDFMYNTTPRLLENNNRIEKITYVSRGSSLTNLIENDDSTNITIIDLPNLQPNIIFSISRNDNNSVYYEKNDIHRSRVRLCDNEYARAGYLGFYTRITMDPGIIVAPPSSLPYSGVSNENINNTQLLSTYHLPDPVETISEEDKQCILCCKFQINMKLSPCEHKICCSICYSKLTVNKCPVCREDILRIMNI